MTGQRPFHRFEWRSNRVRNGLTQIELLVVLSVIGALVALMIPAVMSVREVARAIACKNNLRQLGLAALDFESSHRHFPYTSTSWVDSRRRPPRRYRSQSPYARLIPSLHPTISGRIDWNDETTPAWSDFPPVHLSHSNRELLALRLPVLLCPSDDAPAGSTNYRGNMGVSAQLFSTKMSRFAEPSAQRGAFVNGRRVRPFEFQDGMSTTALFSERLVGDGDSRTYTPHRDIFSTGYMPHDTPSLSRACALAASDSPRHEFSFSGHSWLLGGWLHTWYTHFHGPNSRIPDCSGCGPGCTDGGDAIHAARSLHRGGLNVAFADGSVRFVSNKIEIRVWRAIGTRNGEEHVGGF